MPEAASRSIAGVLSHLFRFPQGGVPDVQLIMPECCWSVIMKRTLGLFFPLGLSVADVTPLSINPIAPAAVVVMNSRLFILFSKG
jgi:hypothetical protein